MADFKAALAAFSRGELEFEQLIEAADDPALHHPGASHQALSDIEALYREGRLPVPVYSQLTQRVKAQSPTSPPAAGEAADAPGDDATRVVSGGPPAHDSTVVSVSPGEPSREADADDGETVIAAAPAQDSTPEEPGRAETESSRPGAPAEGAAAATETPVGPSADSLLQGASEDAQAEGSADATVAERGEAPVSGPAPPSAAGGGTPGPTAATSAGSEWIPPPDWDETESQAVGVGSTLKQRFVLEEVIASGGMGVVYLARDLRKEEAQDRDPYLAIKVLGDDFRRHPDAFRALQRETKKAQQLAHPNIVTVYDFDRDGTNVFMTMERLQGHSLEQVIRRVRHQGLPKDEALEIVKGMAEGLAYAHEKGIVHSDLKPGNVFVTESGTVKLLDFGIARAAKIPGQQDTTMFDAGTLGALTPAYASCEMLEGEDPDPRDDIYALACMTYELLQGRHPFNKLPAVNARDNGLEASPIEGLSRNQWKGLQRGLSLDREARTPSAAEFLREVSDTGEAVTVSKRWGLAVGSSALVLVLVAAFGLARVLGPEGGTGEPQIEPEPLSVLDAETRAKAERLLEIADLHLSVGRVTEPPGSNAYDAYQRVLELHPRNGPALEGIQKIADYYAEQAREKMNNGELRKAMQLVEAGLKVKQTDPVLQELKEELQGRLGS